MKLVLPRNWRKLWFFRIERKSNLKKIAKDGLHPDYLINPNPMVGGHFGNMNTGLAFIRTYGNKVLFFTPYPNQAWNYASSTHANELIRFGLPKSLDPHSIYEDSTGYFGVVKIPPEDIEVKIKNRWRPITEL